MINIVLVDDHKIFRESLNKMFTAEGIGNIIGEAGNGVELLELLKDKTPDVIMMDINMPVMNGIEATKKVIELFPDMKVIALSSFDDQQYYYIMIEAGVKGFVLKSAGLTELIQGVTEVYNGGSWFSNDLLRKVISNIGKNSKTSVDVSFTEKELEVMKLVCEGLTDEQIANELSTPSAQIEATRVAVLNKSGAINNAGLVMYAIKNRLIEI